MKDYLSYADHISDKRVSEKKEILDFIVGSAKDCEHIVFLGDIFNSRNNSSETNREFVEFIERFGNKNIYLINGNHSKKGNGKTAIDFIKEISHPNWHVFTKYETIELREEIKIGFFPYMLKSELDVENDVEATEKIMNLLTGGDILFTHHCISDTTFSGISTNTLKEIVLPKDDLEKRYKLLVAGHIHTHGVFGNTILTGSVFNNEAGEIEKYIWKIKKDLNVEKIKLPGRGIYKLDNPTLDDLRKIPDDNIVKVVLTDKSINIEELKDNLVRFAASLLIEKYPDGRKKAHNVENGAFDFSLESLIKMYSEEKGIELDKLLKGLELINSNE